MLDKSGWWFWLARKWLQDGGGQRSYERAGVGRGVAALEYDNAGQVEMVVLAGEQLDAELRRSDGQT